MDVKDFVSALGADFFTGVPDSQLKALCGYLMDTYGIDPGHHIIAANEGNCVGLAAGYHLATGKLPVVYLQNSGEGNIINPVASLIHQKVYGIPCLFVVGWRGEPGVHDELQHIYQGEVTLKLLEDMGIPAFIIGPNTTPEEIVGQMKSWAPWFVEGNQAAFVVRKGALRYDKKVVYQNDFQMVREEAIRRIAAATQDDIIVSTTGKASRELFEIREALGQGHKRDFLTVGSMGHSSSIALGIALQKPEKRVWCLDGDGAALMHMGAMAVIGANHPHNLVHIILNNQAHETVGGMPTVSKSVDWPGVAMACGYDASLTAETYEELEERLRVAKVSEKLTLLEVHCAIGSRNDLGRPTTTPQENKKGFMEYLVK
jgi:phosphonopyruvate decarboxylase